MRCWCLARVRRTWFEAGDVTEAKEALGLNSGVHRVEHARGAVILARYRRSRFVITIRRRMHPAPRLLLMYHFFHPDDVVGARLFTELGAGMAARGWRVTALTSNRVWRTPSLQLSSRESYRGIDIERVFRPPFDQARALPRLANSVWLGAAWLARLATLPPQDAVIVGSDPAFAAAILPAVRRLWPGVKLIHWCFDLYPEAIRADGDSMAVRALFPAAQRAMELSYRACDAIVDLGPRMRERLAEYRSAARRETIVPWALVESDSPSPRDVQRARHLLFGDARLGLLYSGTLGRAHEFRGFLQLARRANQLFGDRAVRVAFTCRGNRAAELRSAIEPTDTNVTLADFCQESELAAQLHAADLHLLSLRPEWSGLVVPSKFFGSLAASRPVLYDGAEDSDIARFIARYRVGSVMQPGHTESFAADLREFIESPHALADAQTRARAVYDAEFRAAVALERWDALLLDVVRDGSRQAARAVGGTS